MDVRKWKGPMTIVQVMRVSCGDIFTMVCVCITKVITIESRHHCSDANCIKTCLVLYWVAVACIILFGIVTYKHIEKGN